MKDYIVYDLSGRIIRTGSCPDNMMLIQASGDEEFVMEGTASDIEHMVEIDTGNVIKKPTEILDEEKRLDDDKKAAMAEENLIRDKQDEILRKLAIEELKKEGKLK